MQSGFSSAPEDALDKRRQDAGLAMLEAIGNTARQSPRGHRAPRPGRPASDTAGVVRFHQRVGYWLLVLIGLGLAAGFARFWFSPARLPHDFGRRIDAADLVLFAVLSFVIWHRLLVDIVGWIICLRIGSYREAPDPQPGLRVAFITTFVPKSESLDMLRRTVASMLMADYPHDTWVLDEGNDPEAKAMCELLGVRHVSRAGFEALNTESGIFQAKTKGGNHNAWYVHFGKNYDIVAQIDSDFKVRRDFLTKTLGHFRSPRVAFVGTPQVYGNLDNLIARGAAQQTYLFYGPIMRALASRKMTLLIGANHIVRVAALRDVGWYQGHLTEDLATGKRFHAARWQSAYVPEALAIGEGPTTWAAYFNQQYRWAFGCMHIFFTQSPRLNIRMRFAHGLTYFLLEQFYFSGVRFAAAAGLLMLYYLTGWTPANVPLEALALWYFPLVLWRQVVIAWLQRFNVRPRTEKGLYWAGRMVTIAAIPVYFLAFIGVLRKKRVTFKTTPKGDGGQEIDSMSVFRPHLIASALIAGTFAAGWMLGHRAWIFAAWGVVTVVSLSSFAVGLMWMRARAASAARRAKRQAKRLAKRQVDHVKRPAYADSARPVYASVRSGATFSPANERPRQVRR
jgi:cellulose synthase/poly-beta-1,6-N-acetylglucosamine synthase-like glycosyltransferase